jgi:hypothetical protein
VPVTYYLHSDPTPPNWHGDAPPPLTMDETAPGHDTLYDYNVDPPAHAGRDVDKNGGPPPHGDADEYLEWRTDTQAVLLTLRSDITLYLWGWNPNNQDTDASIYLYDYDGSSYRNIDYTVVTWAQGVDDWEYKTITLSANGQLIDPGHQLVIWVHSENARGMHFAYDTITFNSRIQFTGEW